jgi:amino acid permease
MIAIGSSIGTGLFIGTGKMLHEGGPLSTVIGFVLVSICLVIMMQCLAEMSTVLPVSGSFSRYATRFIDPSLGFAIGFQYWLAWTMAIATESSAFVVRKTAPFHFKN